MAGETYNCHDPVFLEFKARARELLKKYHTLAYEQKEEKRSILQQLFGKIGSNVSVGQPFLCDYGRNIYIVELSERLTPDWDAQSGQYFCSTYALPIKVRLTNHKYSVTIQEQKLTVQEETPLLSIMTAKIRR